MDHSSSIQLCSISTLPCHCCVCGNISEHHPHAYPCPPSAQCSICLPPFSTSVSAKMLLNNVRMLPPNHLSIIFAVLLTCGQMQLPWRCFLNWHVSRISDVTDGISTLSITLAVSTKKSRFIHLPVTSRSAGWRAQKEENRCHWPWEHDFFALSPFSVNLSIPSVTRCSLNSYPFPIPHFTNLCDLFWFLGLTEWFMLMY